MDFGRSSSLCVFRENLSSDDVLSLTVVSDVLCVTVIQGQNDWGVTYSSTEICALKGSTVEINCTYRYPSRKYGCDTEDKETFWFTKLSGNQPVDLRTDSDYQDRVEYSCSEKSCSLRITDLRESDSAEYKFKFITNQTGRSYTGSPGVTLRVTGNIYICYISFLQTTNSLCCNFTVIQFNVLIQFRVRKRSCL